MILALSSVTLTEAHLFFLKKKKFLVIFFFFINIFLGAIFSKSINETYFLIVDIFLGAFFSIIQGLEYLDSPLTFNNGACGSIFYMLTGFHGFHVFIGTIFLIVTLVRMIKEHFLLERHILLEVSSLY